MDLFWSCTRAATLLKNDWRQLEDNGEWSKVPSELAQDIPDHLVGNTRAVVSKVIVGAMHKAVVSAVNMLSSLCRNNTHQCNLYLVLFEWVVKLRSYMSEVRLRHYSKSERVVNLVCAICNTYSNHNIMQ